MEQSPQHGYFFRVTKKEEQKVRNDINTGKFTVIETKKDGGTKFTSKVLKRLSEQRANISREYNQKQKALVDKVVEVASTFSDIFSSVSTVVAELDVL